MRGRLALMAALAIAMAIPTYAQTLNPRAQLILRTLDVNKDESISCQELAAFLNPVIVSRLRELGIEPRTAKSVPACGSRLTKGPAPDDEDGRSADENYEEYFRDLVQGALGAANSAPKTDDFIASVEVGELQQKSLSPPLDGTLGDVLPDTEASPQTRGEKAWTDILEEWVNIRQSYLDEQGIGRPAKFSVTSHADSDETIKPEDPHRIYAVKAAVVFTPPFVWEVSDFLELAPVAAYEASISSEAPAKDLIAHRLGFSAMFVRADSSAPFSSHLIDVTVDYLTNRSYEAEVWSGTVQYTPQYRRIGIGQYLWRGSAFDFRWRPYLGVIWADVKNADTVAAYQKQTTFTHGYLKLSGEIKLTERAKLTPEWTLWHGDREVSPGAVDRWQNYRSLEGRLVLSQSRGVDRASLTLTIVRGRNSPGFEYERSTVLALAAKF